MYRNIKFLIIVLVLILLNQLGFAKMLADKTIYETSINWDDINGRTKLLETVPHWPNVGIKALFQVYLHPEEGYVAQNQDISGYNIEFINAFWGPLDNPFHQFSRPAKAFIFIDQAKTSYMAPLMKDETDGNFYVFDNTKPRPSLLNDWVMGIRQANNMAVVHFNICLGYGNYPTDTCMGKSYQDETLDAQKYELQHQNDMVHSTPQSAYRPISQDWQTTLIKMDTSLWANENTIFAESIDWNDKEARDKLLNTVTEWNSFSVIQSNFEKIRDLRYFTDEHELDFMRRITWLYPDDGCWTRASAVIRDFFGPFNNLANVFKRPAKVFAFGNLCANTPNAPNGRVSWWYHTAPIIRDEETNQTYVLDPSVNPYQPLTIEKWINAITQTSGACTESPSKIQRLNICNGYGTTPGEFCTNPGIINFASETRSANGQQMFRVMEFQRQRQLGRDPEKVLGDQPPWKT